MYNYCKFTPCRGGIFNDNAEFALGYVCNRPVKPGDIEANTVNGFIIQPPHDKTNKMTVRPAKTQISLGIRSVGS